MAAALLFQNENYTRFNNKLPIDYLQTTILCYYFSFIKERLRAELEVIYGGDDFRSLKGIILITNDIVSNNMNNLVKEFFKLLISTTMTQTFNIKKNKNVFA